MKNLVHRLVFAACLLSSACGFATDLSITASAVVPGANPKYVDGTAGATITQGQLLYYDSTAGTYKLADSNASATTAAVVGYAANAASSGQPLRVIIEDADMTVGATLSMSAPVYCLSATAGGICPVADLTTGHYPSVVLIAKSTTKAVFKIVRGGAVMSSLFDFGNAPRLALLPPPFFTPRGVVTRSRHDLAALLALAA